MSNKAFTKTKRIELDEKWYITPDADSGVVLTFSETRLRKNKEEVLESYLFKDEFFFPKISQSLEKYVKITGNSTYTIEEILENSRKTKDIIDKIEKEFKQFS